MQITAKELASMLQAEIVGSENAEVNSFARIEEATASDLSFIANPKYAHWASKTAASILLVALDFEIPQESNCTFLKVNDPYQSLQFLLSKFSDRDDKSGIESMSFVSNSAKIGENCFIGNFSYIADKAVIADGVKIYPNCYIGEDVIIGENTTIYSNVTIYKSCKIDQNCTIHAGTVIGSDGFGFAPDSEGKWNKIPQTGNVEIGSNVEIGANSCVDRAVMGSTVIKEGSKLDNLIQVAHNVRIGKHNAIAAQAGISGSSKLGDHCLVGGQAGLVGHIEIAERTKINAQSGVSKSIKETGSAVSGSPAYDYRQSLKDETLKRQLASLVERIKILEEKMKP